MTKTYAHCPRCNYEPAAPLPLTEPCPACGIYPLKWEQHLSAPPHTPSHGPVARSSISVRWAAVDPIIRLKIGVKLACLGAFMSLGSLASGTAFRQRNGYVVSRANTPIQFWMLVLGALAMLTFGACLALFTLVNDRDDSEIAALEIDRPKI